MRVLATHSIRQFPLHFPSHASPCATRFRTSSITFQLDSTTEVSKILTLSILQSMLKKCCGITANRSGDEICGLTLSKGGDCNDTQNVRKVAYTSIYMAISVLAVACHVRFKYSMFARHGAQTMAGCDVISRDNGLVTSRTNQTLP